MNDLDNIEWLRTDVTQQMKARDLFWYQPPEWSSYRTIVPTPGMVKALQGRILSTKTQRSEFIGPEADELSFWRKARYVALDTNWDEPA